MKLIEYEVDYFVGRLNQRGSEKEVTEYISCFKNKIEASNLFADHHAYGCLMERLARHLGTAECKHKVIISDYLTDVQNKYIALWWKSKEGSFESE